MIKDQPGTDLYRRIIAHAQGRSHEALTRKAWDPTPWVVDVFDGSPDDEERYTMMEWCTEHFGPESWPIHDRPAKWYRGGATVDGWTWYGFATEEMMNQFLEAWPQEAPK